jgi:hypothetical protein
MQQPAIQAALNNLVEVIRTALTAEFLEYFRGGDAEPVRAPRGKKKAKVSRAKQAPRTKVAKKKAVAKEAGRRAAR